MPVARGSPATALLLTLALCHQIQGQHLSAESRALRLQNVPDAHGFHGVQRFRQLLKIHESRHSLPGGVILAHSPQGSPQVPPSLHPASPARPPQEVFVSPDLSYTRNASNPPRQPHVHRPSLPPAPPPSPHNQEHPALAQSSHGHGAIPEDIQSHPTTTTTNNEPRLPESPVSSPSPPRLEDSLHHHFESSKFEDPGTPPLRIPEPPRVREIPSHLPLDLVNRLKEYPSLEESLNQAPLPASMHTFFEPTIKVQAVEVTDEEWGQYLDSEWAGHGIVPSFLALPPPYLINVNYGDHLCVHLGTLITPAQARHQPKSMQFPGEAGRLYTILLFDVDREPSHYVNWMVINVPHNQLHKGTQVVEYEPPQPAQRSGTHRMVFLVYLQQAAIPPGSPSLPRARSCQKTGREVEDLDQMSRDLGLKGPLAGNYFLAEWDVTVEHSCTPPLNQ